MILMKRCLAAFGLALRLFAPAGADVREVRLAVKGAT